ncbi:mucin-2 [Drosophila virilis]|uniref:VWFC domain-containing protein n=1 Tax=Drosophila virilis TaxID=7244 RepID=B4LX19_DROVI|nr:serine-rich adhesin for platelets [Drosophila virilis]EDW67766.2 uncharacterized protein Dvir_GJ24342 [Drosophila virilis]
MTRKRSSPLGLEELMSLAMLLLVLPALTQAAPLQEYTEIQQYPEGCYYNYAHYNEGDRIMTNEPCLNCTCHNRMLMCYLRVCPFTKPIGHDCIVEKREDQCCPIITCPEVPVDVPYHTPEPGTELSIPEKFGCSIEEKFYPEGAQVPSNPNKPCELCYCINNQTKCVMQECTLHVDGCTPIYNKGSCCPVRYSCDHENDVLELEDQSTTTTTVRPTPGFILTTTMTPAVSADCIHNGKNFADGASIKGKNACEHCYCMRGDIVCAVQECEMPMSTASGKACRAMPAAEGECCPSNYICEDDSATTEIIEVTTQEVSRDEATVTTATPVKDIHGEIPKEDVDLQEHIDDEEKDKDVATESPTEEVGSGEVDQEYTTAAPVHDDKIQEKEPETSTIGADNRIDVPAESSPATSVEEGSGEEHIIKATTPRTEEAVKPAEPTKEGSGEDKAPTAAEEGSGEDDDITATPPVSSTSYENEQEIVKPTTPVSEVRPDEDGQEATTSKVEISEEEDAAKGTTPAEDFSDKEDVSKSTTPASEVSAQEDVAEGTTPSEDISDKEDVAKGTIPAEDIGKEQDVAKATTPATDVTDKQDVAKDTTPATDVSEEEDTSKATTPAKEVSGEEDIVKDTTPAGEEILYEDTSKPSVSAADEIADEDTVKATTPAADISDDKDIVTATTSAAVVSDDKEDKATTPATDISDEEDIDKATTISADISADKEHKATTPVTDVSDEEDTVKATTPAKEVSGEEDIAKATTPAADDRDDQEDTATTAVAEDKDVVKVTTPAQDVRVEDEIIKATTSAEEESVDRDTEKATTPAGEVAGEGDIVQATTPADQASTQKDKEADKPSEGASDDEGIIPSTSSPEDTSGEEDKIEASTPAVETIKSTTPKTEEDQTEAAESSTDKDAAKEEDEIVPATTAAPHILSSTTEGISDQDSTESTPEEEKPVVHSTTIAPKQQEDKEVQPVTVSSVESDEKEAAEDHTEQTKKDDKETSTEETDKFTTVKAEMDILSSTSAPLDKQPSEQPGIATDKDKDEAEDEDQTTQAVPVKSDIAPAAIEPDQSTAKPDKSEEGTTDKPPAVYLPPVSEGTDSTERVETSTEIPESTEEDITASTSEEESPEPAKVTPEKPGAADEFAAEKTTLAPTTDEETTDAAMPDMQLPAAIPGEGDCLVEGKTYANNTDVPATTPCDVSCKCISSIVSCKPMECKIPEDRENCVLATDLLDGCCPTYICEADSSTAKADESTDDGKSTTIKPESSTKPADRVDDELESTSTQQIPQDVIMPSGITEQPLSHVKPDEEIPSVTTTIPVVDEVTTPKDIKKPTAEDLPTEEEIDQIVGATAAPEIKKEVQTPAEKDHTPEDGAHKQTAETTTEETGKHPAQEPTTTPAATADESKKETEDTTDTTTIAPIVLDEEKPTKEEKPADERVETPEDTIEDKISATTIAPTSEEASTESEEEPSSTETHVADVDKEPVEDAEKIPASSTGTPSEAEKVTTLVPSTDASKPSESTEDSVSATTLRPETEEDQDTKKLHIPLSTTEISTKSEEDAKKPTDDETSTEADIDKKPTQEPQITTKAPKTEEDKETSDDISTSAPADSKDQDETTASPITDDEEKVSSTEKAEHEEEEIAKETTAAPSTEDEVSKVTKLPEDESVSVPTTTIGSAAQADEKQPIEKETPATVEDEIEPAAKPSVTVAPTDADKEESTEPAVTISPTRDEDDTSGPSSISPAPEKPTDDKIDEETVSTDAPVIDVSKKPEDEKVPFVPSSTEKDLEPSIPTSTPSDKKTQDEQIDIATDVVPTDEDEKSSTESSSEEGEQLAHTTDKSQAPGDTITSSTSAPSIQDEEHKVPDHDAEEETITTAAPSIQDDTKKAAEEEYTSTPLEIDVDTKLITTIAPSTADKEAEEPSSETTSTLRPTTKGEQETPEDKIDATTVAPTSEEEARPSDKPIDMGIPVESTDAPLAASSTESVELPEDKISSTTPHSQPENATETATKIPAVVDSEELDKYTTVATSPEEEPSEPFDEESTSSDEEADTHSKTTIAPLVSDKKKLPPLPTPPSSSKPEEDIKKPVTSDSEIEHETDSTTQPPSSVEEDEHISNEVLPTATPADSKSDSTTIAPAEEEIVKKPTDDEVQPKPEDSHTTVPPSAGSEKPSEKEPSSSPAPAKDEPEEGEDIDSTTERPAGETDRQPIDKIASTVSPSEVEGELPTTAAAVSIKADTTTPSADDKIDVSTASPAVAEDDDTEGTTVRTPIEQGTIEDTTPKTDEDKEPARISTTPKTQIAADTTLTPIHVPDAEQIDTKPMEDVMSQTIAPQTDEEKIEDDGSATTSAEDADKIPVTVAPASHDIEATSEVSKKPSATEDVGEETTEPGAVIDEDTTDQVAGAKLKPPTPAPTTDEIPTKAPVEEDELLAQTAQTDLEKETPVKLTEAPESEDHTDKPSDTEKTTVAPTVKPSLDSTEEDEESVESEEEHTPASEDTHKQDESVESTESEESVTEPAEKKPGHDEAEVPAVVSEIPHTSATPAAHDEASTEASSEETATVHPDIASITTLHPLFAQHLTSTTKAPSIDDRLGDGETEAAPTKQTTETTTTESPLTTTSTSSPQHEPITPPTYGHQPQYPSYPEDEYDEEEVFGPGTCRYAGKIYVSAQQIPRDDPCDFCFCFRSDIICLQQSCPPPIAGCHEEPISGFCCPRYECPVSMAAVLNITTSTTTTSTTLPPHFLNYSHGDAVQHTGCLINGRSYKVGEPIESTSGPCISCTCGGDGKMKCDPQQCVPEPTMQQVMAAVASGRKR